LLLKKILIIASIKSLIKTIQNPDNDAAQAGLSNDVAKNQAVKISVKSLRSASVFQLIKRLGNRLITPKINHQGHPSCGQRNP
jgi:hypothetical protein